ncbi:Nitronate monooxygenase [Hypsizygus marmoreus]|uniref:Nitronate monooxygenase n=1 Tax=Hypsizygus marmoreus TaxID=39966 RepID=A0A369JYT2_HYPMA|nr:Nitronate monooxygenase [Hypsizygus marmoreus]
MTRINTSLTKLLNIDVPIISAPMAFAATGDLASAVTSAGGFGFMGAGFLSSQELKRDFQLARQRLNLKASDPVPIGIGFIGWILELTETSDDPRLTAILDEKPVAIWFAFGANLGKYIAHVREYDAKRVHTTIIFVIVNSVEGALRAANDWKVDVVVAQGIEAGGHGGSESPPLLTLVQAITQAVLSGPLIVAAGGISTGLQIAALLTMGVDGVALGTRFLFTDECIYTPAQKEVLLRADHHATTRTLAFDEVGRTMGWPPKHDGRAIVNGIIEDVRAGLDLDQRLKKFDESAASGDTSRLIVWAGVGVGLTNDITPASDVVTSLSKETLAALQSTSKLFN